MGGERERIEKAGRENKWRRGRKKSNIVGTKIKRGRYKGEVRERDDSGDNCVVYSVPVGTTKKEIRLCVLHKETGERKNDFFVQERRITKIYTTTRGRRRSVDVVFASIHIYKCMTMNFDEDGRARKRENPGGSKRSFFHPPILGTSVPAATSANCRRRRRRLQGQRGRGVVS